MQVPGRRRPIPCLGCGYDITGLPREGVCPECALPLRDTLEDAKLLRSIEWSALCRIYLGIHLLAWLPVAFVLLLPLAWVLIVLAALLFRAEDFLTPALCVAGGIAMGAFAVGCWLLGNRAPARSLHPSWARATTLWLGPVVAVLLVASPFAGNLTKYAEPWATLLVRAACQLLTMVLLTAILRLCQILEARTQSPYGDERPRRHRFAWSVIVVLGFVWAYWYWAHPLAAGTVDQERGGWWGEGWALLALIVLGTVFWRVADAVALEWNAARYNREEETFQE
jgi:hypothetical protein